MKWTTTEDGFAETAIGEHWYQVRPLADGKKAKVFFRHFESQEWLSITTEYASVDSAKKGAKRSAAVWSKGGAENAPKPLEEEDPTVTALIEAGYTSEAYNLFNMAAIVRQWQADDIDPFDFIDIIASKHQLKESK